MSRTTTPDQQYQALVLAQANSRAQLRAQAVAIAAASAQQFTGWYDTAAITAWAVALAAQVEAFQRAAARMTDAYLARAMTLLTGRNVRPVGGVDVSALRAGITHAGAYGRAADVYRWQQSQFDAIAKSLLGDTPRLPGIVDPIQAAVDRVSAVAEMDTQLAVRAQEQAALGDAADRGLITGWRRVIHPELSKGGTCGLCIAASDRLYGPHEPKAIHARCECTTLPVLEGNDPGSVLNTADLGRLYEHAGGTGREKLKRTRYQLDEHGELGLVLNPRGAKVRTARDAERDINPARRARTEAEQIAQLRRIQSSLVEALPKVRDLASTDPKTWGEYLTKLEDRISGLDQQLAA